MQLNHRFQPVYVVELSDLRTKLKACEEKLQFSSPACLQVSNVFYVKKVTSNTVTKDGQIYNTVSNSDDVTAELVGPLVLIFALTGAPKPIEESCRLHQGP